MRSPFRAALLLASVYLSCGGQPPADVGVAEDALTSTDPCGVTISPYNAQCTKPGRSHWTCAQYNSVTHRCQRARGKDKLPGGYWVFKSDPDKPDLSSGSMIFYPAWGDTLTTDASGQSDAQVFPRYFAEPTWGPMLDYGWSYDTNDLTPSGINGLQTLNWEYFELYAGTGVCMFSKSGYDFSGFLGCWQSTGPVLTIFMDQVANPRPTVRSWYGY